MQLAFDLNLSAVFLNDSVHDRQPEAGAVIFGREEWIEYVGEIFRFDAFSGIANCDSEGVGRFFSVFLPKAGIPLVIDLTSSR